MGALDTIKSILSTVGTVAGASKDVISILNQKLTLLHEQVASLDRENMDLRSQIVELRQKLQALQQHGGISREAADILQLFFDLDDDLSPELVSRRLHLQLGVAKYHFDTLVDHGFIKLTRPGMIMQGYANPALFGITRDGRRHIVESRTYQDSGVNPDEPPHD